MSLGATSSVNSLSMTGRTTSTLSNAGVLNVTNFTGQDMAATLTGAGAVNFTGTSTLTESNPWTGTTTSLKVDGAGKVLTNSGTFTVTNTGGDGINVTLANGAGLVNAPTGVVTLKGGVISAGIGANAGFTNRGTVNTGTGIYGTGYGNPAPTG